MLVSIIQNFQQQQTKKQEQSNLNNCETRNGVFKFWEMDVWILFLV